MKNKISKLKENKIFKMLSSIIVIIINLSLYLIPNTLINSGFFVFGLFIFIGYLIIYLLNHFIKKKKFVINKNKKELFELVLNSLLIGIFINCLFFLGLQLFNPELSYQYSFGNYSAYKNATTISYLLITVIILPLFNNLLIRRLINQFNTKKGQITFSIFLSLFIFITSSTYVSGFYLIVINILLNFYYISKKSLKETFIIESLIALVLALMILFLTDYKIILIMLMMIICSMVLIKNLKK